MYASNLLGHTLYIEGTFTWDIITFVSSCIATGEESLPHMSYSGRMNECNDFEDQKMHFCHSELSPFI